jgi:hypothetical protein
MKIADLQKVFVDADAAAEHAYSLWDSELEEAYVNLRRAAGRVLAVRGQHALVAKLRANSTHQPITPTK